MKITKFVHSCLLVEMPERTVLFDPGVMSQAALDIARLRYLDDICITHEHADHLSLPLLKQLVQKFPDARVSSTAAVVAILANEGIIATDQPPEGMTFFESSHEPGEPLFPTPDQTGVHYQDLLTHPGDSHSFTETKAVLALPVTAPWGSTVSAVSLALELKPRYVVPIHDWHWRDEAREQTYDALETLFARQGITFLKLRTGEPVAVKV